MEKKFPFPLLNTNNSLIRLAFFNSLMDSRYLKVFLIQKHPIFKTKINLSDQQRLLLSTHTSS